MNITKQILVVALVIGTFSCKQDIAKENKYSSFQEFVETLNEKPTNERKGLVSEYLDETGHKQLVMEDGKVYLTWFGDANSVKASSEIGADSIVLTKIDCGDLDFFYTPYSNTNDSTHKYQLIVNDIAIQTDVQTKNGLVVGVDENGILSFRGIPYAAPPVGEFRWRPPQPKKPWGTALKADTYGCACPQPEYKSGADWTNEHLKDVGISEDCLTLNIWRPTKTTDKPLPVMVYIHGSAWKYASSSWPAWRGDELAREDVIVVNFNYRLGLLGRFAHPALSKLHEDELLANFNIMDEIAVLEWVQENIEAFGGDPDNVTLFGHSAGGVSVNFLMVTPHSKGLFHRAIAQGSGYQIDRGRRMSTSGIPGITEKSMEEIGMDVAEHFGITEGSNEEIAKRLREISAEEINEYLKPEILLNPVVEGTLLPDDMAVMFEHGKQHDVPYITGVSDWESNQLAKIPFFVYWFIAKQMVSGLSEEDLKPFSELSRIEKSNAWFNNGVFFVPSRYLAKQMKNVPSPAWTYHVTYQQDEIRGENPGAPHGLEVPFIFGLSNPNYSRPVVTELSKGDLAFGKKVQSYWLNFAKTGDPNGKGLPEWSQFDPDNGADLTLDLGNEIVVRKDLKRDVAEYLEDRALERRAQFNKANVNTSTSNN